MDDLDLNSQAPDLDFGMSFGELLRCTPVGALGGTGHEVTGVGRGCTIPPSSTAATRRAAPIPSKPGGGTASATRPYQLPRRAGAAIRGTIPAPSGDNADHPRVARGEGDQAARPTGGRRGIRGRATRDSAVTAEYEAALANDIMVSSLCCTHTMLGNSISHSNV